ncbi:hypothetical protein [Streptomyces sp. SID12501]|uniref:Uncharacterized protein n=1 Tax=Streptomyces sp. SID12501 TaxID=2706042 RepID=A0A6B3C5U1_9ACTN|nr:hypothetical protein [Streptomyces sp. SID12501]NEC92187.1 hypothetical protein [Streptomyces sp. SID12501]
MSAGPLFNRAETERRLGPAAVAESRRNAAAAPPLRPEQIAFLRGLFASVRFAERCTANPPLTGHEPKPTTPEQPTRRSQAIRAAAEALVDAVAERASRTPREAAEAAWYPGHPLGSVEAIEAEIIRRRATDPAA